jgi:diaminopimelate epimerase
MYFSKYSASGNDFIVTHGFRRLNWGSIARKICDRHFALGADGFIVLLPHETHDFQWLFYNRDGSPSPLCGNGCRVAALYAYQNKLTHQTVRMLTPAGVIKALVMRDIVEVNFPKPKIIKANIKEAGFDWWLINTGVVHMVALVESLDVFNLSLCRKLADKYDANIDFATLEQNTIAIRTFEKGVEDETLACGTGSAAVFYRANEERRIGATATVYPKSHDILTVWRENEDLFFKGRVSKICDVFVNVEEKPFESNDE